MGRKQRGSWPIRAAGWKEHNGGYGVVKGKMCLSLTCRRSFMILEDSEGHRREKEIDGESHLGTSLLCVRVILYFGKTLF